MTAKEFIKKNRPFKVGANYNVSPAKLEELLTEFAQKQKKEMVEALFEKCENPSAYIESTKPRLKALLDDARLTKAQHEALVLILESGGILEVKTSERLKRSFLYDYISFEDIEV